MSLTAAASGLAVFLLSVSVIQGQHGWGVTYTSEICALKGSTVNIRCSYTYPSRINGRDTRVEKTFWFTEYDVDLETDQEYSGRVQHHCVNNDCSLRITDVRESDSAEYKFRFITNQPGGSYFGSPGVSLSVTDLQVKMIRSKVYESDYWAELKCQSSCHPPGHPYYVWYKNGQDIWGQNSDSYSDYVYPADSFSCVVRGSEAFPSPPVYAPKLPSVSVSPSGEIVEGSSVTLTCSSDANPAAYYTWYKENEDSPEASGQIFTITDFRAEHSGNYYCEAQNNRGRHHSTLHLIVVADHHSSGAGRLAAAGTIPVVLLAVISLSVFLWIRKKRADQGQPEEQGDLQYASVQFSNNQTDPLYSNIRPAQHLRLTERQEVVEYAAVKFNGASTALRTRGQDTGEDPAALYSTVNKP
ncbi:B-cell receptor CD22-like [Sebastes fasciatus]|uniref:B-cell receptor CD22-like n=1 Tax=Sebastes fasciatus TaxID=394691 RepID=UPI003D9E3213